jgi:hypothetical protein
MSLLEKEIKNNSSRNMGKKGRRKIKINECKREIHNL